MSKRRRRKAPPAPGQVHIEKLTHEGRGLGTYEDKKAFIFNALPGETVEASFSFAKRQYLEGQAETITNPHTNRVSPPCPHFGRCGGCALQHLAPGAQVVHKESVLLEQLSQMGQATLQQLLPPLTGPTRGYRTKARLAVKYVIKKDKLMVGFRERGSSKVADINSCHILPQSVSDLLPALQTLIRGMDAYQETPQIELAVTDAQTAFVVRHMQPLSAADNTAWQAFADAHGISLYYQPGGPDTVHKVWPDDKQIDLHYSLPAYDLTLDFHPLDFTQINPAINEKMLAQALSLLDLSENDRVADLFCGLGNFSLPMARFAGHVVGVEADKGMVARAIANAAKNGLRNTTFYAADLYQETQSGAWATQVYDKLLIDPPRSGAAEIIPWINDSAAHTLVYVSCHTATLARDVGLLTQAGWTLESAGIMDMFPHTAHVESMAKLTRKR